MRAAREWIHPLLGDCIQAAEVRELARIIEDEVLPLLVQSEKDYLSELKRTAACCKEIDRLQERTDESDLEKRIDEYLNTHLPPDVSFPEGTKPHGSLEAPPCGK